MKKFLLSIALLSVIMFGSPAYCDDFTEDYIDISANYCILGDYNMALSYLDKILEYNPNNTQVRNLRNGITHIITNDNKSFVEAVNPNITQAMKYKKLGDIQNELNELINGTQNKNAYLAYFYLGNYYRDTNQPTKAIEAYNSAVSNKPEFSQAYLSIAITLLEIGKFNAVINPIDKYLSFNPDDDLAFAIKSRALFQLSQTEEAKKYNDIALSLNDCPEYQFDKAKILYKLGQYKEAKDLFTKLLPNMQNSKTYEYIAYCDYALNNYMDALMNIDKAFILSDDDIYLLNKYNEIKEMLENK